ncbi:MAG: hypothetical protein AVDCRST_MAG10-2608, partial [uncultured Acidimicrobiales bacterium]
WLDVAMALTTARPGSSRAARAPWTVTAIYWVDKSSFPTANRRSRP